MNFLRISWNQFPTILEWFRILKIIYRCAETWFPSLKNWFFLISKHENITPERREITTSGIEIIKFSMLTHVCGVVRGLSSTWCEALSVNKISWYTSGEKTWLDNFSCKVTFVHQILLLNTHLLIPAKNVYRSIFLKLS